MKKKYLTVRDSRFSILDIRVHTLFFIPSTEDQFYYLEGYPIVDHHIWNFFQSLSSSHTFFCQNVRNPVIGTPPFLVEYN